MNKFVSKNINSLNERKKLLYLLLFIKFSQDAGALMSTDHRITHKSGVTLPSWLTDRTDRTDSHILTFSVGSQGPGHGS